MSYNADRLSWLDKLNRLQDDMGLPMLTDAKGEEMNPDRWSSKAYQWRDRINRPIPTWRAFGVTVGLMVLGYFAGCGVGHIFGGR